jgi:hypothetical protein
MYLTNKYTHWYYSIITNAQARNLTTRKQARAVLGYTELHHVIPKSLGGSDLTENIIFLTAREHFICHWLLIKCTAGQFKGKMIYALNGMRRKNKDQSRYETKITSRVYARVKQLAADQHSANMKGKVSPNKGKQSSLKGKPSPLKGRPNGRKGISINTPSPLKGKPSPLKGRSSPLKGRPSPLKGQISPLKGKETGKPSLLKGRKHSVETIAKMKESCQTRLNYKEECPHCRKTYDSGNYAQWHGDKCKQKQLTKLQYEMRTRCFIKKL